MHTASEAFEGDPAPTLRVVATSTPFDQRVGVRPSARRSGRRVETNADAARDGVVALYREQFSGISRLAYLLCGHSELADDLAHDAFLRMYQHWDRVDDPDKRLAYLRSIVVNLAHSAHRRAATARRHAGSPLLAESVAGGSAEDVALAASGRPDVIAALGTLPDRQRTAVVLRHWLRMTEGEIAGAMGCSVGSVRTHVARGHHTLAIRLGGTR